jgi:hypothetical protein
VARPQCSVMSSGRKETRSKQILRGYTVSRGLEGAGRNTMMIVFHVDVVNLLTSECYSIDFCGMSRSSAVSSREGIGRGCGANGLTEVTKRPVVSHRSCLEISPAVWVLCRTWTEKGRGMAAVVNRQPLAAKFRVRSQGSPRGVCGGQSVADTEAQYFGFPLSAFHQCCILVIQHRCCVFLAMNAVFT